MVVLFIDIATELFVAQLTATLLQKAEEEGISLLDEHLV